MTISRVLSFRTFKVPPELSFGTRSRLPKFGSPLPMLTKLCICMTCATRHEGALTTVKDKNYEMRRVSDAISAREAKHVEIYTAADRSD